MSIAGLKGEALSNAMMRAEAKAKRRVALSLCGLGMIDDSEVDSIPGAKRVVVDPLTSEIPGGANALEEALPRRGWRVVALREGVGYQGWILTRPAIGDRVPGAIRE